jgi:glutathione S-transferase
MRARLALAASGQRCELREVVLRDKPAELLAASPKGTVPVLHCAEGLVLEESLAIMRWALGQRDPQGWLLQADQPEQLKLVQCNDSDFKHWLDRYKYAERYPEFGVDYYREQAIACLIVELEQRLTATPYLGGQTPCLSDVAIFPFVRQFAAVDAGWFAQDLWPATRAWLEGWLQSALFKTVMDKNLATRSPVQ